MICVALLMSHLHRTHNGLLRRYASEVFGRQASPTIAPGIMQNRALGEHNPVPDHKTNIEDYRADVGICLFREHVQQIQPLRKYLVTTRRAASRRASAATAARRLCRGGVRSQGSETAASCPIGVELLRRGISAVAQ